MERSRAFSEQVRLLLAALPLVTRQLCFALKGGTALNLFVRDLPRLSVDIDLAYLPLQEREESLAGIDAALDSIAKEFERTVPGTKVNAIRLPGTNKRIKLLVRRNATTIKIEVTPILRGSVYDPQIREVAPRAEAEFGYAQAQLLSFEDLYAGKLCAALDRQHPRDLFDVRLLLANEGITPSIKDAFIVYLVSHNRPMAELLAPKHKDLEPIYRTEFIGMATEEVSIESLVAARERMISTVHRSLTERDRQFLLAIKRGDANWAEFAFPEAERLPAVRWKLQNLSRMDSKKRKKALETLERSLYG
jgi:hypothetical protein